MSNFDFLSAEWKDLHEEATKTEQTAIPDPRTSCFYARRALELAVAWAYKFDRALKLPYQDNISALIQEPTFKQTAGEAVFNKSKVIVTLGNRAVHSTAPSPKPTRGKRSRNCFTFAIGSHGFTLAEIAPIAIWLLTNRLCQRPRRSRSKRSTSSSGWNPSLPSVTKNCRSFWRTRKS